MEEHSDKQVYMVADLHCGTAYFSARETGPLDKADKNAFETAAEFDDIIAMGKTVVIPQKNFNTKETENFEKHGLNKKFDI